MVAEPWIPLEAPTVMMERVGRADAEHPRAGTREPSTKQMIPVNEVEFLARDRTDARLADFFVSEPELGTGLAFVYSSFDWPRTESSARLPEARRHVV